MRIAIALAVIAAGCNGGDHRAQPTPAAIAPAAAPMVSPPAAAVAPAPTPDGLTLLDPGREPRVALRYHVGGGTTSKLALVLDSTVMGETMPTVTLTSDVAVDGVLPDGAMKLRVTIDDIAAHDAGKDGAGAMVGAQLATLDHTAMTATLSPIGEIGGAKLALADGPASLGDQLRGFTQSLGQLALPLPTPPVGVGARWRITRAVEQGGMKMTVATDLEVTAISDDRFDYTMTARVAQPPQTVTQGGLTVAVGAITGAGSGTGSIDLGSLAIRGDQQTSFSADMTADGQTTRMDANVKLTMAPAPPPKPAKR